MKRVYRVYELWAAAVSLVILVLVLSASTYAWFTINRLVATDKVTARTGTDTLTLQISSVGGSDFRGSEEAELVQVNETSLTELMPVSTADLKTFVYNPVTIGDMASVFPVVEDEKYYYHGRIYLRAAAEGIEGDAKMALYLDEDETAGGALAQAEKGELLQAARLGLLFDGSQPVIFDLGDEAVTEQTGNTLLNGSLLENGQVLDASGGRAEAVTDPAIPVSERRIRTDDLSLELPVQPLIYMELNRIYAVDVYFYLEGCDPDCTDSISFEEVDLHLAFYGILAE